MSQFQIMKKFIREFNLSTGLDIFYFYSSSLLFAPTFISIIFMLYVLLRSKISSTPQNAGVIQNFPIIHFVKIFLVINVYGNNFDLPILFLLMIWLLSVLLGQRLMKLHYNVLKVVWKLVHWNIQRIKCNDVRYKMYVYSFQIFAVSNFWLCLMIFNL